MKKYFFVNFLIVIKKTGRKITGMSVMETGSSFFPIIKAKNKIAEVFRKDIGTDVNVIFNTYMEVGKETFDEFHKGSMSDFARI